MGQWAGRKETAGSSPCQGPSRGQGLKDTGDINERVWAPPATPPPRKGAWEEDSRPAGSRPAGEEGGAPAPHAALLARGVTAHSRAAGHFASPADAAAFPQRPAASRSPGRVKGPPTAGLPGSPPPRGPVLLTAPAPTPRGQGRLQQEPEQEALAPHPEDDTHTDPEDHTARQSWHQALPRHAWLSPRRLGPESVLLRGGLPGTQGGLPAARLPRPRSQLLGSRESVSGWGPQPSPASRDTHCLPQAAPSPSVHASQCGATASPATVTTRGLDWDHRQPDAPGPGASAQPQEGTGHPARASEGVLATAPSPRPPCPGPPPPTSATALPSALRALGLRAVLPKQLPGQHAGCAGDSR